MSRRFTLATVSAAQTLAQTLMLSLVFALLLTLALPPSPSSSFTPDEVPNSAVKCPPAERPIAPMRSAWMPYVSALARRNRTAALQS